MKVTDSQRRQVTAICTEHGVARLAVFGSQAQGSALAGSDLDLLVEFAPGRTPGFFALAELAGLLSEALGGLPVDLRTPRDLSRYFRDEVVAAAEVLYAA